MPRGAGQVKKTIVESPWAQAGTTKKPERLKFEEQMGQGQNLSLEDCGPIDRGVVTTESVMCGLGPIVAVDK